MKTETAPTYYVTMIDTYMSGWGRSQDRRNAIVISCPTEQEALRIEHAANKRDEMKHVTYRGVRKPYYDARRYYVTYYQSEEIKWK